MSWIVFWMDPRDTGDRVGLAITTVLTIMFLLGSVNMSLPRVSYPKAIDWYLIGSFLFVFLVLVECILVYILRPRNRDSKNSVQRKDLDLEMNTINNLQVGITNCCWNSIQWWSCSCYLQTNWEAPSLTLKTLRSKNLNSHLLPLVISYRSSGEKLIKYQANRPFALRGHATSFLWKWKIYDSAFEKRLVCHILNKIKAIWFFKPAPFS